MDDLSNSSALSEQNTPQDNETGLLLQQQFHSFVHNTSAEQIYILFNSANHPELPQQYYTLDTEQRYSGLLLELLEGYNEQSISVMPYLIKINSDNIESNPFIDWLFSTIETRESFFALSSNYDLTTVTAHWDGLSQAYSSQQQVVILRLFDARISQPFLLNISQSDQQQLLGPCQSLWFANESGQALIIDNPSPNDFKQTAPWFHLTPQHETLLADKEENALLYNLTLYLWENHPDTLAEYSADIVDTLIAQSLKKALGLGFTQPDTIYFCASLFFYYSPVLYQNHLIQTLWSNAASEQQQIQNLREKISTEQWQQIAQPASIDDWMNLPDAPILITE